MPVLQIDSKILPTPAGSRQVVMEEQLMKRLSILLVVFLLPGTAPLTQAEDGKLGVTFDLTYMSKYMSNGDVTYCKLSMKYEF